MSASKILLASAVVTMVVTVGSIAWAQTGTTKADATKKEALAWLDNFAQFQVLFHEDDVKKLRQRVEAMSPQEAASWWEKTGAQRDVLSSPQWRETERWLRDFLRVQAKYSDEDIRYFQSEAATKAKESAPSLQEVLNRVTQARGKLIAGSQAAEETRKMQLAANEAYRQEEVRRREEARRQANAAPTVTVPAPAAAGQQLERYNAPLIDSLDVARWKVLDQLFPRW
jgi:hypothetical protein